MTRGWFGPKRIGYGVGPRTWQGWLATAVFVIVLAASNFLLAQTLWGQNRLNILAVDGALLAVFLVVVWRTYDADA